MCTQIEDDCLIETDSTVAWVGEKKKNDFYEFDTEDEEEIGKDVESKATDYLRNAWSLECLKR